MFENTKLEDEFPEGVAVPNIDSRVFYNSMRLSASAVGTFLVLAATSTFQSAEAFTAVRGPLSPSLASSSSGAFLPTAPRQATPIA